MKKTKWPIITLLVFCLLAQPVYAAGNDTEGGTITGDDSLKDFVADSVDVVWADNGGEHTGGNSDSNTYVDTRTEAEKEEDAKRQEIEDLQKQIQDILDQMGNSEAGSQGGQQNPWGDIPGLDDWLQHGGSLPDWNLDNPELPNPWSGTGTPSLDLDNIWDDFLSDGTVAPGADQDGIITGNESPDPQFSGKRVIPTDNGIASVSQQRIPLELLAELAGREASLMNPQGTSLPTLPDIDVSDRDQAMGTFPSFPDIDGLMDDFLNWGKGQSALPDNDFVSPDDFFRDPNFDGMEDLFPGLNRDTIPGTGIGVEIAPNMEGLYELLLFYMAKLNEINMSGVNITRFTVYQVDNVKIATTRQSVPLDDYRWVVYSSDGAYLNEKETNTPYVKLLFQEPGLYNVHIFNNRQIIRNNLVSGQKSEIWVLSNGGFFDGLVVYNHTTSFRAYISEDVGPTVEEIELLSEGFDALVTDSMCNIVQLIDDSGNIRSPRSGFTTQRG